MILGCASHKPPRIDVPSSPPAPKTKFDKPVKLALVLSSGGFRGGAHIGVLEVLEENNIPIDLIVGASAGSFIGALYADNPNARLLKSKLLQLKNAELLDASWVQAAKASICPTGPVLGHALQRYLLKNMDNKNFETLKIPLVTVMTNMKNNKLETLQTGPIIPAVHASSAMPPLFAPVHLYHQTYIDGGVIAPVPVHVAKRYNPEIIVAVDISKQPSLSLVDNAFELTNRAIDISFYELASQQASVADVVIRPDLTGFGTFEEEFNEEFYLAGRKAALAQLHLILEKVALKNEAIRQITG